MHAGCTLRACMRIAQIVHLFLKFDFHLFLISKDFICYEFAGNLLNDVDEVQQPVR